MKEFLLKYWVEALFGAVGGGLAALWGAFLVWRKKQRALETGVQALLRDRIIQACEHYLDKGALPVYGLENIENMYKAYHTLGGNGAVTKLVEEVKALPTRH